MSGYQRTDMEAQGAHPHSENMLPTPTLQDVIQAIVASWEALEQKTVALSTDVGLLRDDHRRLVECVTVTERELSKTTPVVAEANKRLTDEAWSWAECQPGPGPVGDQRAGKRRGRA
ncbi:hypothetical protein NDU88_005556 [Pleurodeles waltl]|uniref:Uncharacterized protein n=1 Tax=Pleurodeles waltl TaxID=8319 RepID=A0AAV7M9N9_PLEWA|nr:hypothetical protein NDU88_005556 [Pleurodeles waltl]